MDQLSETAVKAIADLVKDGNFQIAFITPPSGSPGVPTSVPVLLDPKTGRATSLLPLVNEWRTTPARKHGTANVSTLESFMELVDRHKTDASVIFANIDWQAPSLTAVVDYHEAKNGGSADNGKHRIHYEFPLSDEWQAWIKIDGKPMDQTEFAEFIEDHISELASPDDQESEDFRHKFGFRVAYPVELVTLSRGLQIFSETRIKNAVTLQSGEGQIVFEEEHKDAAGNRMDVPGMFILAVPPFFMGEPARVPVRLRYRLSGGSIKWTIKLYRPDIYITQQVLRDVEKAASITGLPHFKGEPEMSA